MSCELTVVGVVIANQEGAIPVPMHKGCDVHDMWFVVYLEHNQNVDSMRTCLKSVSAQFTTLHEWASRGFISEEGKGCLPGI